MLRLREACDLPEVLQLVSVGLGCQPKLSGAHQCKCSPGEPPKVNPIPWLPEAGV